MKLALPTANVRNRGNGSRAAARNGAQVPHDGGAEDSPPTRQRRAQPSDPIVVADPRKPVGTTGRNGALKPLKAAQRKAHAVRAVEPAAGAAKGRQRGANGSEWRPIATFVVEFELRGGDAHPLERRTRAHHHETMLDKAWPGFVRGELCDWIAAQVQDQINAEQAQHASAPTQRALAQIATPALDWHIGQVRVARAGNAERIATLYDHGRCTPALLAAGSAFVIELDLERTPTRAGERSHVDGYQVRALNRDTRVRIDLGAAPLVDGSDAPAKTLNLNVAALAGAGSYRLECVPLVAGHALDAAAVSIPLLQVV